VDPDLILPIAIGGGILVVAIAVGIAIAVWVRRAPLRAAAAALATFEPFARRFGVGASAHGTGGLPQIRLAGPGGRLVTIDAELVSSDAPMNDEPGAWVRKTLLTFAWIVGSVVVLVIVVALADSGGGPSNATRSYSSGSSTALGSGRVRRTTLVVPLQSFFAPLVLKAKHGLFRRLFTPASALVLTGDAAFDAAFWTKGPPDHVRALLTPPVRAALLAFRAEHGRFGIEGGRLLWSRRTYATQGIDRVLDGITRLIATLG
jgi:hypothetical protein